jgi:tetratricopeptide (TPR) repeat protein
MWSLRVVLAGVMAAWLSGCATRTLPPPPAEPPAYSEFLFPTVPAELQRAPGADGLDRGWRWLQSKNLANAETEFAATLKRTPGFYPAQAGLGYVAIARERFEAAISTFDAALETAPQYVPALVGRGQSLLALGREEEALAAFESALATDGSLADVRQRVEVLRFRNLQAVIERARAAAAAGRMEQAREAYGRAIDASPESAFLHRELGLAERQHGSRDAALEHFTRASELDPADSASLIQLGELFEQRREYAQAEAAYRKAAEIVPSNELSERIEALLTTTRDAALPAQFRSIATATEVSRGDLAALLAVRLPELLRSAPGTQVVVTDVRGHWAAPWITRMAETGIMEPFANHTFQPQALVRRGDLARAVSRVVALAADSQPRLRERLTARPRIADMNAGHLDYPAVAVAVGSGVMPLLEGERFFLTRAVSGSEAVETVGRLQALLAVPR